MHHVRPMGHIVNVLNVLFFTFIKTMNILQTTFVKESDSKIVRTEVTDSFTITTTYEVKGDELVVVSTNYMIYFWGHFYFY